MDISRKNSRKRSAMLELLRSTKEHPTAEMLYNKLKLDYPELSLATVYRNLAQLVADGVIISVGNVSGQERYDANIYPHTHFICRSCSRVIDVEVNEPVKKSVEDMYDGILCEYSCLPETHSLTVSGLCDRCRG